MSDKVAHLLNRFTDELIAGRNPKEEDFLRFCPKKHRPELAGLIETAQIIRDLRGKRRS